MHEKKFYLGTEEYVFRGLTILQRRQETLEHLQALVEDGFIEEELAVRLYDAAILMMGSRY